MDEEVVILMATFNGEKYIIEQIESILDQTYKEWKLVIRDDNSTDATHSIIENFAKSDSRICFVEGKGERKGACQNFSLLLEYAKFSKYVMFSDQDDVWYKEKIEYELNIIKMKEKHYKRETPIVVYTNYLVSDKNLEKRHIAYRKEYRCATYKLLIANWVMGCSMIINNPMLKISLSIPLEADNHDQWITILASICGKIVYFDKPTFIHRIHSDNVTVNQNTSCLTKRAKRLEFYLKNANQDIVKRIKFCNVLSNRLKEICINNDQLVKFRHLLNIKGLDSIKFAIGNSIFAVNIKLTFILYLQLFFKNK